MKNLQALRQKFAFNRRHGSLLLICVIVLLVAAAIGLVPVLHQTARTEQAIELSQARLTELQELDSIRQGLAAKLAVLQDLPLPPPAPTLPPGSTLAIIRHLADTHRAAITKMETDLPSHSEAANALAVTTGFSGDLAELRKLALDLLHLPKLLRLEMVQLRRNEQGFTLETRLTIASDF